MGKSRDGAFCTPTLIHVSVLKKPWDLESRARRNDGVYRWFQSRGSPLRDESGRIVRWYNLLIDVDERKRAEDALFSATLEARVGERMRIARELHDTLLQSFQGLLLRFHGALELLPNERCWDLESFDLELEVCF